MSNNGDEINREEEALLALPFFFVMSMRIWN